MSVNKKTVSDHDKTAFAIVGELVMMSTALDHLLNQVLITVLDLGTSEWLEPVTATLDPKRKLEILRGRAAHMPPDVDWKTALIKFCDMVDIVFTKRNIVCHIPPFLDGEVWKFVPVAAAKMLKNLDLSAKTVRAFPLNDLKSAIATGETALASGMAIITNFRLVNAEIRRARAPAGVSSEN